MAFTNLKASQLGPVVSRVRRVETMAGLGSASVSRGALRVRSAEGLIVEGSQTVSGSSAISGAQTISGSQTISGTETITGTLTVNGAIQVNGDFTVETEGALFNGEVIATGGLSLFSIPTTTSPANLRRSSLGVVEEVTSAARFKIDPEPMDLPDELLAVPVEWWIDRGDAERFAALYDAPRPFTREQQILFDDASLARVPGVIAEKVAAAGGEAFVGYTADGVIHSVAYDRLALARTAILARKLDEANEAIARLTALVETLTGD